MNDNVFPLPRHTFLLMSATLVALHLFTGWRMFHREAPVGYEMHYVQKLSAHWPGPEGPLWRAGHEIRFDEPVPWRSRAGWWHTAEGGGLHLAGTGAALVFMRHSLPERSLVLRLEGQIEEVSHRDGSPRLTIEVEGKAIDSVELPTSGAWRLERALPAVSGRDDRTAVLRIQLTPDDRDGKRSRIRVDRARLDPAG